jgi:flavodoxin
MKNNAAAFNYNFMRSIVIFYSRTGNTQFVAETIASIWGSELIPLKDKKKRSGVLGWLLSGRDAYLERQTEIEQVNVDLEKYDIIFLGCPNWASNLAPAIRTFIAANDFAGKKAVLFCTQDGMGAEKVFNNLRRVTIGADIVSEKYFNKVNKNKEVIRMQIKEWLDKLSNNK